MEEKLYQNTEWMRGKYVAENLHVKEIAELAECSSTTIINWLPKLGIPLWEKAYFTMRFMREQLEEMCSENQQIIYCAELGYPDLPIITDDPNKVMPFLKQASQWGTFLKVAMCMDHHGDEITVFRGTIYQNASQRKIQGPKVRTYSLHPLRDYTAYIQSKEWHEKSKSLREKVKKCQICSDIERLRVHHNTYQTLGDEQEYDVTVLCDNCHNIFHSRGKVYNGPRPRWLDIRKL